MNFKNQDDSISSIKSFVADELAAVDTLILEAADSKYSSLIEQISQRLIKAGGKRIRPTLTLATAKVLGYKGKHHISLATAVEFIHTATLLHDDVIDESLLRRGIATANRIWGNKPAILVGDYLFSQAFKLMVSTSSLSTLETLAQASKTISEAEIWQLDLLGKVDITHDYYIGLVKAKTAALFGAACKVGAIIASAPNNTIGQFEKYGINLGIAFQIVDDILDYTSSNKSFGKRIGNDFIEGKVTMPVIIALERANEEDKDAIIKSFDTSKSLSVEERFRACYKLIEKYDGFGGAKEVATQYISSGHETLGLITSKDKSLYLFHQLIDFVLKRLY